METTLTSKGQATIPKHIRDRLGLKAGSRLVFEVNKDGELVLRPVDDSALKARREALERAIANVKVDIPWHGTTDEYMALIRGED
jgi:AbrB family looped-hinge helix DNA binding protein